MIKDTIESIIRTFDDDGESNFDDDNWYGILAGMITDAVAEQISTVLKNTLDQTFLYEAK